MTPKPEDWVPALFSAVTERIQAGDANGAVDALWQVNAQIRDANAHAEICFAQIHLLENKCEKAKEKCRNILATYDATSTGYLSAYTILADTLREEGKDQEADEVLENGAAAICKTAQQMIRACELDSAKSLVRLSILIVPAMEKFLEKNEVYRYVCGEPGAG